MRKKTAVYITIYPHLVRPELHVHGIVMEFTVTADSEEELETSSATTTMADRGPLEVILRGGKPWGFYLSGGGAADDDSPLHVSQVRAWCALFVGWLVA